MLDETVNIVQCRNAEGKRMLLRKVQQQNLRIDLGFKPVTETLKLEKQQLLPKGSSALSSLATEAA